MLQKKTQKMVLCTENLISQPTVTNDFLFQILFISAGLSLKEPLSREAQPSISSSNSVYKCWLKFKDPPSISLACA
jgi:hypothetical protein